MSCAHTSGLCACICKILNFYNQICDWWTVHKQHRDNNDNNDDDNTWWAIHDYISSLAFMPKLYKSRGSKAFSNTRPWPNDLDTQTCPKYGQDVSHTENYSFYVKSVKTYSPNRWTDTHYENSTYPHTWEVNIANIAAKWHNAVFATSNSSDHCKTIICRMCKVRPLNNCDPNLDPLWTLYLGMKDPKSKTNPKWSFRSSESSRQTNQQVIKYSIFLWSTRN